MEAAETPAPTSEMAAPPYVSFRTVLNIIERMADDIIPPQIDRSYLSNLSGGYQGQVLAAFRWLGLIDEEGRVQDRLIGLVKNAGERRERFAEILREKYPEAIALGDQNATQGQLDELFRKTGITRATVVKAVKFYLHAAEFAGIAVSPLFKPSSSQEGKRSSPGRRPRIKRGSSSKPTPEAFEGPASNGTLDALRTRYVEMLMTKAEEQDQMDDNLLNRIEALLGYGEEPTTTTSSD